MDGVDEYKAHDTDIRCVVVGPSGRVMATGGADCCVKLYALGDETPKAVRSIMDASCLLHAFPRLVWDTINCRYVGGRDRPQRVTLPFLHERVVAGRALCRS